MNTLDALIIKQSNLENPLKVFDWVTAAKIIKERKPEVASAGLSQDWEWTGGDIFRDGKPIPADDTHTYLASIWATPELDVDGEIIDCYIMESDVPKTWVGDLAKIYWPDEALQELEV